MWVVTASRHGQLVTREHHDEDAPAWQRANELMEEADLVIVSNKDTGIVRHFRNMKLMAGDRYR